MTNLDRRTLLRLTGGALVGGVGTGAFAGSATAAELAADMPVVSTVDLNVREGPGTDYNVKATADQWTGGEIVDGPTESDGYTWWKVSWNEDSDNGRVTGWSIEDDSGDDYITGPTDFSYPCWGTIKKASSSDHTALDIEKASGQKIGAARDGTVSVVNTADDNSCGKYVKLSHDGDWETLYCRLSSVSVSEGESVTRDQKIGEMGSTGDGSGTFVHFEIRYQGGRQSIPGSQGNGLVEGAGIPKSYYDDGGGGGGGGSLNKRVVGYYPEWAGSDYQPADVPYDKLSHLIYAFLEPQSDGTVVLGDSSEDDLLTDLGSYNDDSTTFLLSISGGWYPQEYSDAASTSDTRQRFARTAVDHVIEYGFDGLDLDWEFPDGTTDPDDPDNFVKLLAACRQELDDRVGTDAPLTIAASANTNTASDAYKDAVFDYVDFVSVMTYDYHGDWSNDTNFNAPLQSPPEDPDGQQDFNVSESMQYWSDRAIADAKLNMGFPFYGRSFTGVASTNDGLFQDFDDGSAVTYEEITNNLEPDSSYEKFWHHDARQAWLYSGADARFVAYDDKAAVSNKLRFLKRHDFGGAMAWELSQDPDAVLLDEIHAELSETEPQPDKPSMEWVSADDSNYASADRENDYDIRWYINHVAEGSYEGTIDYFQDPDANVSTHYVIENDDPASATQMVDESDVCWHAGNSDYNDHSLGIEHEGYTDETYWTDATYEKSARIARWACLEYDIPLRVRRYDVAPCNASNGDGGIIGHNQVPDASDCEALDNRSDPGTTFNWGLWEGYLRRNRLEHREHLVANADVTVRDDPAGTAIDTAPQGTTGTVTDGPIDRDGTRWYEIEYDGGVSSGWSAGDDLLYARFDVGHVAESEGVNVRDGPGTSYDAIDSAASGTEGTVVDGPVFDEGWTWWKIDWNDGTATGWSADYYLNRDH